MYKMMSGNSQFEVVFWAALRAATEAPACKVRGYKKVHPLVQSIFGSSNQKTVILVSNLDVRSARLFGQLWTKPCTSQAGASVPTNFTCVKGARSTKYSSQFLHGFRRYVLETRE